MKKTFGFRFVGWLAALALFNVIVFVTPNEIDGVSKFDTLFWISYGLISLLFVGHLVCLYFIFRNNSFQKTFLNLSLLRVSNLALAAMLIVGGLCMAVIQIPTWVGVILCSIVLAVFVMAAMNAAVAAQAVAEVDKKIKTKTFFVKMLTADALSLANRAEGAAQRALANKVYEAVRYSDPMSDDALASVENSISQEFREFTVAIEGGNLAEAESHSKTLLSLLSQRNAKCKMLK